VRVLASHIRLAAAVSACSLVAACGDSTSPANHSIDGLVQEISRVSPGCSSPKILVRLFGCGDPYYLIELAMDASVPWRRVSTPLASTRKTFGKFSARALQSSATASRIRLELGAHKDCRASPRTAENWSNG